MIEVIKNYLTEEIFSKLTNTVYSLPWILHKRMNVNSLEEHHFAFIQDYNTDEIKNNFKGIETSLALTLLDPYLRKNQISARIIRSRTNLYIRTINYQDGCGYHTDIDSDLDCLTLLLYLEDSNGATEFRDTGERIISERNKAIIFPCNLEHQTISQTDTLFRTNVNINFVRDSL